ncbi:phytanoyl-coa dioxygenase phyh [Plakobranchus ocellatus]|uniref:Phytanoyl-coa dioxygenase phyh n=1 Tax=Plakobranchus ocellatus TaxID=259542 RepID=A0AAV3YST1_9GAST|nr:phytanoyl-coa dioxygenase phyh [Plakobranchus ocellatus]
MSSNLSVASVLSYPGYVLCAQDHRCRAAVFNPDPTCSTLRGLAYRALGFDEGRGSFVLEDLRCLQFLSIFLHGIMGAVYLEECAEDDWTFEVIEGSHKHFDQFMEKTGQWRCRNVKSPDLAWFEGQGCYRRRVPCPKGGMVLWDSRLFHSSARPLEGRQHPGRWRFVVFVCMTPSAWATPSDLETKRKAYTDLELTKHWPSQRVRIFTGEIDPEQAKDPIEMHVLPEVAKTDEARRLAGVLPYGEENDDSNGDGLGQAFTPVWDKEKWVAHIEEHKKRKRAEEKKRAESIQS